MTLTLAPRPPILGGVKGYLNNQGVLGGTVGEVPPPPGSGVGTRFVFDLSKWPKMPLIISLL